MNGNGVLPPPPEGTVLSCRALSRWYGQVIGINDVNLDIGTGVTGLLGPNGAGKSTLLKLVTGQLKPSRGSVSLFGETVWDNPDVMRRLGFCPEQDAFYERMSGLAFVSALVRLNGYSAREAREKALKAIERVGLTEARDKKIGGYSKGMRQRIKMAQALVHEPQVLVLDEPLAGMDPVTRRDTIDMIRDLGASGGTVIVSSHILHEVEAMTTDILVVANGRIVAEGNVHAIRDLIDEHPHRILLQTREVRRTAEELVKCEDVHGIRIDEDGIVVETVKPDAFYRRLPSLVLEHELKIESMLTTDDNLQAVFDYLVR